MRMAEDEFVAQAIAYVGNVEGFGLGTHLGIEDDVQKHVAEFFAYLVHVMSRDSGSQFVGLFDGVLAQTVESLFAIPRAFLPQVIHDVEQSFKGRELFSSPAHSYEG